MKIGVKQKLKVKKFVDFGVYLTDGSEKEVLLPRRYEPEGIDIGDSVEVFLYTDSEDRLIATTEMPYAFLGDIAVLKVVDVSPRGCYLDIGLLKDIFMPIKTPEYYKKGMYVAVSIELDKQERLIARVGRIKEGLKPAKAKDFKVGDSVNVFVFEKSDLGFGCIVNKKFFGMIFRKETFENISIGTKTKAFIKNIRDDGKLDLSLRATGEVGAKDEKQKVLDMLIKNGGALELHYDTPPEVIVNFCGMSKKGFKRALTSLIEEGKIKLYAGEKIELIK